MRCGCGYNVWVWLVGVVVRRYIDFLILLIAYSTCISYILQLHPPSFILKRFFHSFVPSSEAVLPKALNGVGGHPVLTEDIRS